MEINTTSAIFYTLSFLIASQGLAIISNNPHLQLVRTPTQQNPLLMYIDLAYNISIIMLLGFALRKMAKIMGRKIGTKSYQLSSDCQKQGEEQKSSEYGNNQSVFVDIAIMLGLDFYFYDQSNEMKAAIFTLFLCTLYLKVICPYLVGPVARAAHILGEGMLYSVFLVLALKIQLLKSYKISPYSSSAIGSDSHELRLKQQQTSCKTNWHAKCR